MRTYLVTMNELIVTSYCHVVLFVLIRCCDVILLVMALSSSSFPPGSKFEPAGVASTGGVGRSLTSATTIT